MGLKILTSQMLCTQIDTQPTTKKGKKTTWIDVNVSFWNILNQPKQNDIVLVCVSVCVVLFFGMSLSSFQLFQNHDSRYSSSFFGVYVWLLFLPPHSKPHEHQNSRAQTQACKRIQKSRKIWNMFGWVFACYWHRFKKPSKPISSLSKTNSNVEHYQNKYKYETQINDEL